MQLLSLSSDIVDRIYVISSRLRAENDLSEAHAVIGTTSLNFNIPLQLPFNNLNLVILVMISQKLLRSTVKVSVAF